MISENTFKENENEKCMPYNIEKGYVLYYARIIPNCGIYDVVELKLRTVNPDYFVGTDKNSKQAFIFSNRFLEKTVFKERKDALKLVKEKEKNKKVVNEEKYYEEY